MKTTFTIICCLTASLSGRASAWSAPLKKPTKSQKTVGWLAVSAAGLGALVKSSLESADALAKLSQRVGISVESLSTLIPVAELSGVSAEKFEGGIRKLAVRMLEAATDTDDAIQAPVVLQKVFGHRACDR